MKLYVIRHAKAGNREKWFEDQDLRPLTKAGRKQAAALVKPLAAHGITKIVSSPAVRCRQTVEPLGEHVRLPVDLSDAIGEGAPVDETLALVDKVSEETAMLCTHGDVVGNLLAFAARSGVRIDQMRMEKAATWAFDLEEGTITSAAYVPPPDA